MPTHPTLFLRKEVYKKHGHFNTSFKIAGDYDFMLRVMTDPEMHLQYLPEVMTRMRVGGARPVKFVRKDFTGQAPAA
jgi:glycosyltransferase